MPNTVFAAYIYDRGNNMNEHEEHQICLEDILDSNNCIDNTIYFNTEKEIALCINEIYERGYELHKFPMIIEKGNFLYPDYKGDEEFEYLEQLYHHSVDVIIKRN